MVRCAPSHDNHCITILVCGYDGLLVNGRQLFFFFFFDLWEREKQIFSGKKNHENMEEIMNDTTKSDRVNEQDCYKEKELLAESF